MKRKILTALALFLVLALACSGICFAETDDTPFFAEEKGFAFTSPHTYDPFVSYVHCDAPSITPVNWIGSMSAPEITKSLPDTAGMVKYTISNRLQSGISLLIPDPNDFSWWENSNLGYTWEDYMFFDYTTGQELNADENQVDVKENTRNATIIQIGDKSYEISTLQDKRDVFEGDEVIAREGDRWLFSVPIDLTVVNEITAPVDYDGIVIGIQCKEPSREYGYYDDWEYWDDFDFIQNWEFIRLKDYAAYETLKVGSHGQSARQLQQRLVDLGYLSGGVDGDYGNGTAKAVSAFQTAAGLEATGIADDGTLRALFSADAPRK